MLLPPPEPKVDFDFVALLFNFGSEIRLFVDREVVLVVALDGLTTLAGGAGLAGPPAASDEAVAAA